MSNRKLTSISDRAIRKLVREAFDEPSACTELGGGKLTPVEPNPVVDPSAALTDPADPNYRPNTAQELSIAIQGIMDMVPEERFADVYSIVKQAVGKLLSPETNPVDVERPDHTADVQNLERGEEMSNKNLGEAALRKMIRGIIMESLVEADDDQDQDQGDAPAEPKARKKHGTKSSSGFNDAENVSFGDIAKTMVKPDGTPEFKSVSGAKQAVDKAQRKGRFINWKMNELGPDWMKELINDYLDELGNSGEMTPDDFQLMADNPDIVMEMPGFQEFLNHEIEDMGYFPDIEFNEIDPETKKLRHPGLKAGEPVVRGADDTKGGGSFLKDKGAAIDKIVNKDLQEV